MKVKFRIGSAEGAQRAFDALPIQFRTTAVALAMAREVLRAGEQAVCLFRRVEEQDGPSSCSYDEGLVVVAAGDDEADAAFSGYERRPEKADAHSGAEWAWGPRPLYAR